MRSCAGTGVRSATRALGVRAARRRRASESKRRYGTGSDVWVRSAHGVAWSGSSRMRYGSPPSASTSGPMMSASHRSSAATFSSTSPWCPASSVASTCSRKKSRSASDARHGVALRDVVVVEARRSRRGRRAPRCRRARRARARGRPPTTADRSTPKRSAKSGSCGRDALTPEPDLRRDRADLGRGRARRPAATRPSARRASPPPGPSGSTRGLPGEVVRRHALGVGPVARHDAQVAVLDAGVEAHAVAPAAERGVERGDDRVALLARRGGRRRSRPSCRRSSTVTRLQRYATSSGARSTPIAAASIGARPVWYSAGS